MAKPLLSKSRTGGSSPPTPVLPIRHFVPIGIPTIIIIFNDEVGKIGADPPRFND